MVSTNKVVLEHSQLIHLYTYCLWLLSHYKSRVATVWPTESKILSGPAHKKFADPIPS